MSVTEGVTMLPPAALKLRREVRGFLAGYAHDWTTFARKYNGPNFAQNDYDNKLARAFAKFSTGSLPDLDVRTAQRANLDAVARG